MLELKVLKMNYQSKKYIVCSIVLFSLFIKAQDITTVKDQDTVFILFKPSEKFKKYEYNGGAFFKACNKYTHYYSDYDYVVFTCCNMLDFDRKALVTTVKKRWLKKQPIITEDFLKNMGLAEANRILFSKKLFVIEAKDYKKRKILIKQATFFSSYQGRTNDVIIEYINIKTKDSIPKQ